MLEKYTEKNDGDSKDNRQYNRYFVNLHMRIIDKHNSTILGDVADINIEGMKLISKSLIPTQKMFYVQMDIMMGDQYKDQLDFETISIWSRKDINTGLYETGFLNTLSLKNLDKIQKFIDLIVFVEGYC